MEKVRLSLDELEIQSFSTATPEAEQRGTVQGHDEPTDYIECPTGPNDWQNTCAQTCNATCYCGTWGWTISRCW
ncbi:MAG TPA: hypothetical protein VEX86_16880 [Longimicrobium sp.]|nr:hypothetical protein [Longimicrobium sp.]